MKITFEIYYHTRWGESLFLSGDIDELGFAPRFDKVIVNDDLETAEAEVLKAITEFLKS